MDRTKLNQITQCQWWGWKMSKCSMFALICLIWLWRSGPSKSINCGNKFLDISEKLCRTTISLFCFVISMGPFLCGPYFVFIMDICNFALICLSFTVSSSEDAVPDIVKRIPPGPSGAKRLCKSRYLIACFCRKQKLLRHNKLRLLCGPPKTFWRCPRFDEGLVWGCHGPWLRSCSRMLQKGRTIILF